MVRMGEAYREAARPRAANRRAVPPRVQLFYPHENADTRWYRFVYWSRFWVGSGKANGVKRRSLVERLLVWRSGNVRRPAP